MTEQDSAASQVQAEAEKVRAVTQFAIEQMLLTSILDSLEFVERLSVWLLAITGGALPLLLSNARSVLELVSANRFRVALVLIAGSALCGTLCKARMLHVAIWRHMHEAFLAQLPSIFEQHNALSQGLERQAQALGVEVPDTHLSPEHLSRLLLQVAPKIYQRRIKKAATTTAPGDQLQVLKKAVQLSHLATIAVVLQVTFFLSGMIACALP